MLLKVFVVLAATATLLASAQAVVGSSGPLPVAFKFRDLFTPPDASLAGPNGGAAQGAKLPSDRKQRMAITLTQALYNYNASLTNFTGDCYLFGLSFAEFGSVFRATGRPSDIHLGREQISRLCYWKAYNLRLFPDETVFHENTLTSITTGIMHGCEDVGSCPDNQPNCQLPTCASNLPLQFTFVAEFNQKNAYLIDSAMLVFDQRDLDEAMQQLGQKKRDEEESPAKKSLTA